MKTQTKKVVVIGAGIVGVSTAIWLLRAGHEVTLIDRSAPGEGTSYGNAGILASCATLPVTTPGLLRKVPSMAFRRNRPLFMKWSKLPALLPWLIRYLRYANGEAASYRAKALLPLIGDSLPDHQDLAKGTGAEDWIVPCEYVYGYGSRSDFDADRFAWDIRRESGFGFEQLARDEFRSYDPIFSDEIGYAAVLSGHGRICDPGRYVKDLAAHAVSQGARLIQAEVQELAVQNDRVLGVRASGNFISSDAVVLTAGVWSDKLARQLGLKVPMQAESGFHMELWEPSVMPRSPLMVANAKFAITPMKGRIRLAGLTGFGRIGSDPPEAPYKLFDSYLRRLIPGLTWKETKRWMGHRPSIVDSLPLIGSAPRVSGAFVGFGHDHVGLTAGPQTGRILAQLVSEERLNIDIAPFAPDRFS
ncbi:MAG: FAD-binding oxidoreductase [Pseudomonadota bacterium]